MGILCRSVPLFFTVVMCACTGHADITGGLLAHYPLDGGPAATGGTVLWPDGKHGQCADFQGGWIEVSSGLNPSHVTVAAWVKLRSTPGDEQVLLSKWYSPHSYVLEFYRGTSQIQMVAHTGESGSHAKATTGIPLGEWVHVAGTYDGQSIRVYVNGAEAADPTPFPGGLAASGATVVIGAHSISGDRNPLDGCLDDVRIYGRALSSTDVAELYDWSPPAVTNIVVSGPASVPENSVTDYSCTAHYDNGSSEDVTAEAAFTAPGAPSGTHFTNGNQLVAGPVAADTPVTVQADYQGLTDTTNVLIVAGSLMRIEVSGPEEMSAGETRSYTSMAYYDAGPPSDVTWDSSWSLDPEQDGLHVWPGGRLVATKTSETRETALKASYTEGNETRPGELEVTVLKAFTTWINCGAIQSGADHQLFLNASSDGPDGPAVTYRWDTDGDGQVDDAEGQMANVYVTGGSGSLLVRVLAEDSQERQATASVYVPLDDLPVGYEPASIPVADVNTSAYYNADGEMFTFDADRSTNGLLIVTHGLCGSGLDPWVTDMTAAMEGRLGGTVPNTLSYDWQEMSDPDAYTGSGDATCDCGNGGGSWCGEWWELDDFSEIRAYGLAHGQVLADWILENIQNGNVDTNAPIQIVGHSAGGFVATACATALEDAGMDVSELQITLLDTPFPVTDEIEDFAEAGGHVELVNTRFGCVKVIMYCAPPKCDRCPDSDPAGGVWKDWIEPPEDEEDPHGYAHEWYLDSITDPASSNGFHFSPFFTNGFHGAGDGQGSTALTGLALDGGARQPLATSPLCLTTFLAFGDVAQSNGSHVVTEAGNAGVYTNIALPVGAETLSYRYRFASPGDGDFLAVAWGTNEVLHIGLDTRVSRDGFATGYADILHLSGRTNNLIFKLTSRGDTNAVVVLSSVEVAVNDDPDGDGLLNGEEQALGTDPLAADTDGDGLDDLEESQGFHSDPLVPDTDGDGLDDGEEVAAGTSPTNAADCLRLVGARAATSGVEVAWSSASNRTYRLNRSGDMTRLRDDYSTVAAGVDATPPTNVWTDGAVVDAGFYWVEVE